ncbi:MAG: DUF748 domain-containing protein [Syntrophorhabdaceae bacterium]
MIRIRQFRKLVVWLVIIFVIFTISGFFLAPPIIKSLLVKRLSTVLSRPVVIGKINFNPYTLGIKIQGVKIGEKTGSGTFFSVAELRARLGLSLIGGTIALYDLSVKEPYVSLIRNDDGSYNFSDLLAMKDTSPAGQQRSKKEGPVFSLRDLAITNGSADFWDGPVRKKHTVRELNLSIPLLSNSKKNLDNDVQPHLSLKLNDDPYVIRGRTKPFHDSLETNFIIDFENVDIPVYLAYLPIKMQFSVPSGFLDTKLQLSFRQFENKGPSLSLSGDFKVSQLLVNDGAGKQIINIPVLAIKAGSIEPLARKIQLLRMRIEAPEVVLTRDKFQVLNILKLLPDTAETKKAGKTSDEDAPQTTNKNEQETLQCTLDFFELTGGKISFTDLSLKKRATISIEDMEIKGEKLSLAPGSSGSFDAKLLLNKKGTVILGGNLSIDPLFINSKVNVKDVDIRPFEPYFAEKLRISFVSGSFATQGDLNVKVEKKRGPQIRYKGLAAITNLATIEKESTDSLLRFKSLHVRNLDLGINPAMVTAKGVSLTDFFANIAIKPDKTVNLQDIFVKDAGAVKDAAFADTKDASGGKRPVEEEESVPVKIDTVTLQGGTIRLRDESVHPSFTMKLDHIGGKISGLSSKVNTTADVELRGTLETAPLEITGKINPLSKDLYVDLKASFKDMDLSPATPYSGKYAGYAVDKGKLSFDVQYLIEKRKLDSKNTVFIDQLTFGEKVESPDATKLPVRLAVALLKDRKGQIKLDLPVTGSLDDPEFSVWKIVLKIIVNLLTKAATAPFSLIGSMFGGGEDLDYIEFDYGRTQLTDADAKKIAVINKILAEKSDFKMEIQGYVDMERDREGLKHYLVQKKLRAQKLKDLMKKSAESIDIDEIEINPKEYEKYLRLAYKTEKFPKPRNIIGLEKSLPVPEMEKLMLTNTKITEDDLHSLAGRRAKRVMEGLLKTGEVEAGRLFIVDNKSLRPQKNEKLKDSRVEFKLK